jgi:two-component system, OmpR family, phosphate regulon sensor histidine kinase PhoR
MHIAWWFALLSLVVAMAALALWFKARIRADKIAAEWRRADDQARQNADILASLPDAFIIYDHKFRLRTANSNAERFFGFGVAANAGKDVLELLDIEGVAEWLPEADAAQPLWNVATRKEPARRLSLRRLPHGIQQWLLIARDITQIVRLEVMRRDFVANFSHEIRTPLTVIAGYLDELDAPDAVDSVDSAPVDWAPVLPVLREQTLRMQRMCQDLLKLSALENSLTSAPRLDVDLRPLLKRLQLEATALAQDQRRLSLWPTFSVRLLGDSEQIYTVLSNLVRNAIAYSGPGAEVRLSMEAYGEDAYAISVTDTGIGIAAEHLPRLTERFYRVDPARSRQTGGSGLGLAIVKHILDLHQARLEIDTEPGKGSCFRTIWPAERVQLL